MANGLLADKKPERIHHSQSNIYEVFYKLTYY